MPSCRAHERPEGLLRSRQVNHWYTNRPIVRDSPGCAKDGVAATLRSPWLSASCASMHHMDRFEIQADIVRACLLFLLFLLARSCGVASPLGDSLNIPLLNEASALT